MELLMSDLIRSQELLDAAQSRLLIIDVQEKLVPVINGSETVIQQCQRLIQGAQLLNVPVTATEQYPQGLGPTVQCLAELVPDRSSKIEFSCRSCLDWIDCGTEPEARFRVVVAGIEAHVCVLQTVLDLLSFGFRVYVVADAVSSRKLFDREIALQRMAASGAVITTTEAVLFEWCERAGSPEFKQISRLIRDL